MVWTLRVEIGKRSIVCNPFAFSAAPCHPTGQQSTRAVPNGSVPVDGKTCAGVVGNLLVELVMGTAVPEV